MFGSSAVSGRWRRGFFIFSALSYLSLCVEGQGSRPWSYFTFPETLCQRPSTWPRSAAKIAMANGSDFLSVTSWMSRLSRSAFVLVCCCCWSSGSTGTYGVNVGGKIFSCLEGRWWNVDARRLMNPQVKQQWKQLWPDFERAGKKRKSRVAREGGFENSDNNMFSCPLVFFLSHFFPSYSRIVFRCYFDGCFFLSV